MPKFLPVQEQFDYIKKGVDEIIDQSELCERLEQSRKTGKPLLVKTGFDPTAPDLHLGHTVLIRKMKHFQDMGHTVIFLIGDFTGMIGDPSGLNQARRQLTPDEVKLNADTYKAQVFKILSRKTRVKFNSRWLSKLKAADIVRLLGNFTVSQMLDREDFRSRLDNRLPISLHELFYPIAQAYDSVALHADVELGGTDQKFNLLRGRDLQKAFCQPPQVVLTVPLLHGTDGIRKMSKSFGNYIGLNEPPQEMYSKIMSISDELMWKYYELLTDVSIGAIQQMKLGVSVGHKHPMELKKSLARRIVQDFHSAEAARVAGQNWTAQVQKDEVPENIETQTVLSRDLLSSDAPMDVASLSILVIKLLVIAGFVSSASEGLRKLKEGAVYIDGEKHKERLVVLDPNKTDLVLKLGKRIKRIKFV